MCICVSVSVCVCVCVCARNKWLRWMEVRAAWLLRLRWDAWKSVDHNNKHQPRIIDCRQMLRKNIRLSLPLSFSVFFSVSFPVSLSLPLSFSLTQWSFPWLYFQTINYTRVMSGMFWRLGLEMSYSWILHVWNGLKRIQSNCNSDN